MGIITFLKERRKEALVKKLNRLRELCKNYSSYIDYYSNSIDLTINQLNNNTWSKASYFMNPPLSGYSYTESLTEKYDTYNYYSYLYDRTLVKIERLQNRLKMLN